MTLPELYGNLTATGLPVAYGYFKDEVKTPFITYHVSYTNNFGADNKVHMVVSHIIVTLWTSVKDMAAEGKVEEALSDLYWNKEETFLSEEEIFEIEYEIEAI